MISNVIRSKLKAVGYGSGHRRVSWVRLRSSYREDQRARYRKGERGLCLIEVLIYRIFYTLKFGWFTLIKVTISDQKELYCLKRRWRFKDENLNCIFLVLCRIQLCVRGDSIGKTWRSGHWRINSVKQRQSYIKLKVCDQYFDRFLFLEGSDEGSLWRPGDWKFSSSKINLELHIIQVTSQSLCDSLNRFMTHRDQSVG